MLDLIDTHCHLASFLHNHALENVLDKALSMQVRRMIAVGTSLEDWSMYQDMAKKHKEHVRFTVGLHPCYVDEGWDEQVCALSPFFADDAAPLAIGEIGLDYFHLPKNQQEAECLKDLQEKAFRKQLSLALQLDCPIIVHSRNAFWECVKIIDESQVDWRKVVFHCFVEGPEEIKVLNKRGGRGSFTGVITYKNAEKIRQAALAQGIEKLMLETDAPYLTPEPYRSQLNEPANIKVIAEYSAALFGLDVYTLGQYVTDNSEKFFNWK